MGIHTHTRISYAKVSHRCQVKTADFDLRGASDQLNVSCLDVNVLCLKAQILAVDLLYTVVNPNESKYVSVCP